jgi:hypothetical protein
MELCAEAGHGGFPRVDPIWALGQADIPRGEFWNGKRFWVTKEAASAAHLYGRRFVDSESFTGWRHWLDGPLHYKQLFDVALCAGLNRLTFHTFTHNPPEAGLPGYAYHAGEHFNANNTWWKQSGPMLPAGSIPTSHPSTPWTNASTADALFRWISGRWAAATTTIISMQTRSSIA